VAASVPVVAEAPAQVARAPAQAAARPLRPAVVELVVVAEVAGEPVPLPVAAVPRRRREPQRPRPPRSAVVSTGNRSSSTGPVSRLRRALPGRWN